MNMNEVGMDMQDILGNYSKLRGYTFVIAATLDFNGKLSIS